MIPWPPIELKPLYDQIEEQAAWYSDDPLRLANLYADKVQSPTARGWFWARQIRDEMTRVVHVPFASDIARMSAAMVLGEAPRISVEDARGQERLVEIVETGALKERLQQAAEIAAALGGVFLKIDWDRAVSPVPLVSVVHPDAVVPTFQHGMLTAATFWQEIPGDDKATWRLLETRRAGNIYNQLYRGTADGLGVEVDLTARSETADLPPVIDTGSPVLTCCYIPNTLPHRRLRGCAQGMGDCSGAESLLDSIDQTATSLLYDVLLGQGRLVGPEDVFLRDDNGLPVFDLDRRIYLKLDALPSGPGDIQVMQFAIRAAEHITVIKFWLERVIVNAGYSPQTFGLSISGSAESGTALDIRERKTIATVSRKAEFWRTALAGLMEAALWIDAKQLGSGISPERPVVEMQESLRPDVSAVADTLLKLEQSVSASVQTRVQMLHPDWGTDLVEAETARILQETGQAVPDAMQTGDLV